MENNSLKNLKELQIRNWLGQNTRTSSRDMSENNGVIVRNVEISPEPGRLICGTGYELAGDVLGAAYVTDSGAFVSDAGDTGSIQNIENIYEWTNQNETIYVAHITTDDHIRYWNNDNAEWTRLDDSASFNYDKARFITRNDALVIGAGVESDQYPVYIAYQDARTQFGAESYSAGYQDSRNLLDFDTNLVATDDGTGTSFAVTSDDMVFTDYCVYYLSCLYDGYQDGDMSGAFFQHIPFITPSGYDESFRIYISSDNAAQASFDNRITHINVWRGPLDLANFNNLDEQNTQAQAVRLYQLSLENPTTDDTDWMPKYATLFANFTANVGAVSLSNIPANDCYNNLFVRLYTLGQTSTSAYARISDCTTDSITVADTDGTFDSDGFYVADVVSRWWTNGANYQINLYDNFKSEGTGNAVDLRGHAYTSLPDYNYKYAIVHKGRQIVAPVYDVTDGKLHNNWLAVSSISGEGNYTYDVYGDVINLSDYNVGEIRGLGRILDYLLVFTDVGIFKINIGGGSLLEWSIEEVINDSILSAPDSLVFISDNKYKYSGYYHYANDGIRVYDGYQSVLINEPIETQTNYPLGVSGTTTTAVAGHDTRLKQYVLSFPSTGNIFKYDLQQGQWITANPPQYFYGFLNNSSGQFLGVCSTDENTTPYNKVVLFDTNNTYDGSPIAPYWQSKKFDFGTPRIEKILHEMTLSYQSNTAVNVGYRLDTSSFAYFDTDCFTDNTGMTTVTVGFPIGARCYELDLTVNPSDTDSNTSFKLDNIIIGYSEATTGRIQ